MFCCDLQTQKVKSNKNIPPAENSNCSGRDGRGEGEVITALKISRPMLLSAMSEKISYRWQAEYNHHAKFDIYHINSVRENRNIILPQTDTQMAGSSKHWSLHTHIFHLCQKLTMHFPPQSLKLSLNSLMVRAPDSWSKGCQFESWQEQWENFLLQN